MTAPTVASGSGSATGYGVEQVIAGSGFVPDQVPMKPNVVPAPGDSEPFHGAFLAVTTLPLVVSVVPQDCATAWPPASVQFTVQLPMAVEPAVTVTSPWKPPGHEPTTL